MWWSKRKNNLGFSLQELMVVTGIVALLAAASTFGVLRYRQDAEDSRVQAELASVYKGIQAYQRVYGRYPRSYAELSEFISIPSFNERYEINPNP